MSEAVGKPGEAVLPIENVFSLVNGKRSMLSEDERRVIDRYVNDGLSTVLVASATPEKYSLVRATSEFGKRIEAYNEYAISRMIIMIKIVGDLFCSNTIRAITAMPEGHQQREMLALSPFPYDFGKLRMCSTGWSKPEECSDKYYCGGYCEGLRISESTRSYLIDIKKLFKETGIIPNKEFIITCPTVERCDGGGKEEHCFNKREIYCATHQAGAEEWLR